MDVAVCKPRREASEETKPAHTLILSFEPPELGENRFLCFKPPVFGSPSKRIHLLQITNYSPSNASYVLLTSLTFTSFLHFVTSISRVIIFFLGYCNGHIPGLLPSFLPPFTVTLPPSFRSGFLSLFTLIFWPI